MTEKTEKKRSLQEELSAANQAAQDVLREHAVTQGLDDGEKDSSQNSDKNAKAAEPNKDDNIEHFEKMREDRLKAAEKEVKDAQS